MPNTNVGRVVDASVDYKRFSEEEMFGGLPLKIVTLWKDRVMVPIKSVKQYQEKARYYKD